MVIQMDRNQVMLITGTRKGIGRYLAEYYAEKGFLVVGCSRGNFEGAVKNYEHFQVDISDEDMVKMLFAEIRKRYESLDIVINNAGIASMNHSLLTPKKTVNQVFGTNFMGTFLFCREGAKLMQKKKYGRIVNLTTVAVPLKLEGEAIYASSKAAVTTLTQCLARELAEFGITVNAVGPTAIKTDLTRPIPERKLADLVRRQAIGRYGEFRDISNVIDFFIRPESDFITGQVIYLGGVS